MPLWSLCIVGEHRKMGELKCYAFGLICIRIKSQEYLIQARTENDVAI